MRFTNNWTKAVIFIITINLLTFTLNAKTYKWSNISQQQYTDNLVDCELQLQKHKWSKYNAQKNNKAPRRPFNKTHSMDTISQQVHEKLKMQAVLHDQFNTTITDQMLQNDINRMAQSTKDAEGLKALFKLFDNDMNTVAQCISRPYLVRQKTQSNFDFNSVIHQDTKRRAQNQLEAYLDGGSNKNLSLQENTMTFIIDQGVHDHKARMNDMDQRLIKLSPNEYESKLQQLLNSDLTEKDYGYVYSQLIEQGDQQMKVKTLTWYKRSFNLWIAQQNDSTYTPDLKKSLFTLPKITGNKAPDNLKAGIVEGFWSVYGYIPSARALNSAVWTGSEVIIWGGDGSNTGGRYDPVVDSWQPTSTGTNVPSSRTGQTAIWDDVNHQMIVWGGYDGGRVNTGGRYNPLTDSWQPTSTGANTPVARNEHVAIWDNVNNQMIIWGGNSGSSRLNSGGRYEPSTDTWQPTSTGSNVPSGRTKQTAIWDDVNKQMIVWGGYNGSRLNTGGRYDPSNDSWQTTSTGTNVPSGREGHSAIWDKANNQMIVWGGYASDNTNTGGRYDPSTDSWQATNTGNNVPIGRNNHAAVWDDVNNQMLIWSGIVGGATTTSGGRYDPNTDSWQSTNTGSNVPSGRYFFEAIWTGSEMIVWGGSDIGGISTNTGGRYDPSTDSWQATFTGANMPSARKWHTAIWDDSNNQMIVWGGNNGSSRLLTGGRYDPITNSWQATSTGTNVPGSREFHTAIWDNTNNQMIVWGGYNGSRTNTGGRYDPNTDSWQATNTGIDVPSGRQSHSALWDSSNNQMIIWGGYDGTRTNTGGRYDPITDSWLTTSTGIGVPSGRQHHSAIWDTSNSQMIIWGGNESGGGADTGGRYDPVTDSWQATTTINAPSGRYDQVTVWDTSNNQMIVWGGYDGGSTDTGGRYDPNTDSWQSTSIDSNVPTARTSHTAIWDDRNKQMIVWGGVDSAITNTGGFYDPDTDSWQVMSVENNTPPPRAEHTAIWNGSKVLIWGGVDPQVTKSLGIYFPFIDLIYANGFEYPYPDPIFANGFE